MPAGASRSGPDASRAALSWVAPGSVALSARLLVTGLPGLAVPFVVALTGASEAVVLGTTACIVLSHRLVWRLLVAPARQ